jgi:hypothetical protein
MSEGVRTLIGDKGAKAVLRDAGRQSGPKLLESLIGHFPEVLNKEEAFKRACIILEDLGFAKSIKKREWECCDRRRHLHGRYNGGKLIRFPGYILLCGSDRGLCFLYERPESDFGAGGS